MRMAIFQNGSRWLRMRKNGAKRRAQIFVILALGASGGLWAPLGIVWLSLGKLGEALGTQDGARTAPDGAKMAQDEAKMAQDEAKMIQDGAQTSPEERRKQNKKKSIHPNSRSSSFAGSILYKM